MTTAFPRHRVVDVERFAGGLRNSTYKVWLDPATDPVVLRIYDRDPAACRKESDLLAVVRRTVPVPEVVHAEPDGAEGCGPFAVMRYVEGITFRELKARGDGRALAEAAYSAGETLAAIGRCTRADYDRLPSLAERAGHRDDSDDPTPRFVERCLASPIFRRRAGSHLVDRLHVFAWSWVERLAALDEHRSLVHGDFNKRNVLVSRVKGAWAVTGVLDWELAFTGSPLVDVASFLRYERALRPTAEPHFSRGFSEGGGHLPDEWQRLARALDLASLCGILAEAELPGDVADEVLELVRATIEDRDPA